MAFSFLVGFTGHVGQNVEAFGLCECIIQEVDIICQGFFYERAEGRRETSSM